MMSYRIAALFAALMYGGVAAAAPLTVPFDFSRSVIGLDVTVKGTPLFMMLDTGVDPSVIDAARASSLGLKIDSKSGGEASGEGDAKQAEVYPTTIDGLAIAGRSFAPVDALAADTATISRSLGRKLDGVLGYSFLADKIVLIDYAARRLVLLDRPADAEDVARSCRKHWTETLRFLNDDGFPVIPDVRFSPATARITLDTGSNGGIALYQRAFDLPGLRAALREKGTMAYVGARGVASAKRYVLKATIGLGPFTLPAGQEVTLRNVEGSPDTRLGNAGNLLFAGMKLKLLLDYRDRLMTFYGACR